MGKKERSPAIQFYFRQFAGDEHVMALDLDAVGAHILLMCAAGASNRGYKLPSDERMIRNIIRNPSDLDWQRIKCQLLSGAWKISKDGHWWEQRGMRRSIQKRKAFIESQSRKGKAGMEARWKDNHGYDSAITQHNSSSSSSTSSSNAVQKIEPQSEHFQTFWDAYPRKIGKPPARRAWAKIPGIETNFADVLDGLEHWKRSAQWSDSQFIPYPATFLNQRRWEDREAANGKAPSKHEQRQANVAAAAQRTLERTGSEGGSLVRFALPSGSH